MVLLLPLVTQEKIYFPGLNGLRFFAALMVIIEHVEWIKKCAGLKNFNDVPFIDRLGDNGVTLFFVLSGFLITYLLLQEIKTAKTIHVKYFYLRRILRIWPLYYLITLLSFFVLPYLLHLPGHTPVYESQHFGWLLTLFIFFLPNLSQIFSFPVAFADPLWSVGVEEQFYLVWPHILKKNKKRLWLLFLSIIIGITVLRKFLFLYRDHLDPAAEHLKYRVTDIVASFMQSFTIECMAIGGLAALLVMNKHYSILHIIYSRVFQSAVYILMIYSFCFDYSAHEALGHLINSVFFACIILNVSGNPKSLLKLDNSFFNHMGKISYGLYIYHYIFIGLAFAFLSKLKCNEVLWNGIFYLSVLILTTVVASLSYKYFEKPFLKLKEKYTIVKNTPEK